MFSWLRFMVAKRHLWEHYGVRLGYAGHSMYFKRQDCVWILSPPLPLFHFSSTLQSSQEWHIIIFQNVSWHTAQVITATSFSNLLAYIFIFLTIPLCSSAQFYPWLFAFPFNVIQPHNSLLSMHIQFLFELPRNPIGWATILQLLGRDTPLSPS